jgi:hypothetical protein
MNRVATRKLTVVQLVKHFLAFRRPDFSSTTARHPSTFSVKQMQSQNPVQDNENIYYSSVYAETTGWITRHSHLCRCKGLFFSSPKCTDRLWGPPNPLFNTYQVTFSRIKRPGRDVDQQHPRRFEVTNEWSYPSNPTIAFLTSVRTTVPF